MNTSKKLLGGILLVSGTTIGAAMLALPVSTGMAGATPSLLLFVACWLLMTFTAFLVLETTLWMGPHANLNTIARKTLGRSGELFTGFVYLFLLYALTTAYIAGSTSLVQDGFEAMLGYKVGELWGAVPLLIVFGFLIYRGIASVDRINRLLMVGLAITYLALVFLLVPHVQPALLAHTNWPWLVPAVSVVATSFGFHIVIPTLVNYLDRNVKLLKKAIWIGSLIPLIVYIVWEIIALGIIPIEGEHGLWNGYQQGTNGASLLGAILGHSLLSLIARCFSFFAIITSFLGVSLSLNHFLADSFKIKPTPSGRGWLVFFTLIPPMLLAMIDPRAFLTALEYAGAFGVIVLLAFLPALMTWSGRYVKHLSGTYQAPGGKLALIATMAVSLMIVLLEIAYKTKLIG